MISQKSLKTFKKLFRARFKEKLTDKEALERATRLLNLYRVVYGSTSYKQINQKTPNNQAT